MDLLLAQLVCTSALFGLIWTIQLAHYPAFIHIDEARAPAFHQEHSAALSLVAAPLMIGELCVASALFMFQTSNLSLVNLVTVGTTWLLTFALSVPVHNRLAKEWNKDLIHKLIRTNWPRTIVWTARIPLLIFWLSQ